MRTEMRRPVLECGLWQGTTAWCMHTYTVVYALLGHARCDYYRRYRQRNRFLTCMLTFSLPLMRRQMLVVASTPPNGMGARTEERPVLIRKGWSWKGNDPNPCSTRLCRGFMRPE